MSRNTEATDDVNTWAGGHLNYKEGFFTQLQTDELAKGINEEVVRAISAKRNEPDWMLEFRLNAFQAWQTMEEPHWLKAHYDKLNYQEYSYYSAPSCGNCDETCTSEPGAVQQTGANAFLSKEVEDAFEQLGVPVREGKEVAVDAIFDSVSVATTYRDKLAEQGIIFCSFGEAIHDHPELVKQYLGTVVPGNDNFFAALNAAVASDGTFIYVPKGVRCPMELSTYFRINAEKTGQFERTILVADEGSYVSYIEGCSAPKYNIANLHAGCVELFIGDDASLTYSTIENWSKNMYNLNTKRAIVGKNGTINWVTGSFGSHTSCLYPMSILQGEGAHCEFTGVTFAGKGQYLDTGSKVVHNAPNTTSNINSKSISKSGGVCIYRGSVVINPPADGAKANVSCESLMLDEQSQSDTIPAIVVKNDNIDLGHEASIGRISDEAIFYLMSRGLSEDEARAMLVRGFVEPVSKALPLEYAVEMNTLINLELKGSLK